jgi:hypothetical protein
VRDGTCARWDTHRLKPLSWLSKASSIALRVCPDRVVLAVVSPETPRMRQREWEYGTISRTLQFVCTCSRVQPTGSTGAAAGQTAQFAHAGRAVHVMSVGGHKPWKPWDWKPWDSHELLPDHEPGLTGHEPWGQPQIPPYFWVKAQSIAAPGTPREPISGRQLGGSGQEDPR